MQSKKYNETKHIAGYTGNLFMNKIKYTIKELCITLNEYKVKYIITFNKAGNAYGWSQAYSEIELVIDNSIVNLYRLQKALKEKWKVNIEIQNIKKLEKFRVDNMNLTLWLWMGFRTYKDITFIERNYNGNIVKLHEKKSLIDCIKYNQLHIELRAFLALEDDLKVDRNCQFWYIRTL